MNIWSHLSIVYNVAFNQGSIFYGMKHTLDQAMEISTVGHGNNKMGIYKRLELF